MSDIVSPLVCEVVLEMLRPGPPHNQLLSPLTPYLALCSSHSAETVHVPFEQWQLLRQLRELDYQEEDRSGAIQEVSRSMAEIIGRVAGLGTELQVNGSDRPSFTHLRLIISASELALLPWELALAPKGFPGEGTPLLLQTASPLSLTREMRRPQGLPHRWPEQPRVLFASAAPETLEVPFEEHLYALRRAIDPWVRPYDRNLPHPEARRRALAPHLTVLPSATLEDIRNACSRQPYTHVHVLAHGLGLGSDERRRFGLALHAFGDPQRKDVVSGERLASALISQPHGRDGVPHHPTVVTVASCQGADTGSVAFPGGSLAHDLHRAGIPLVIASQFPLTVAGSVLMAQTLYERLLWWEDPRLVLRDLRTRLHALEPQSHDWASLVAYLIVPQDLSRQLLDCRYERSLDAVRASLEHADDSLHDRDGGNGTGVGGSGGVLPSSTSRRQEEKRLERSLQRLKQALNRVPEDIPGHEAEALCHKGARLKRWAQILHRREKDERPGTRRLSEMETESGKRLEEAWQAYRDGFSHTTGQDWKDVHWSGTQFLSLSIILGRSVRAADWDLLVAVCKRDLERRGDFEAWANADLVELHVLAQVWPDDKLGIDPGTARQRVIEYAGSLCKATRDSTFILKATRRQLARYVEWWHSYNEDFVGPAIHALSRLPDPDDPQAAGDDGGGEPDTAGPSGTTRVETE